MKFQNKKIALHTIYKAKIRNNVWALTDSNRRPMLPVAVSEGKLSVHPCRSYPGFVIKRFSHTIYMLTNRSTYILIVINHINLI